MRSKSSLMVVSDRLIRSQCKEEGRLEDGLEAFRG